MYRTLPDLVQRTKAHLEISHRSTHQGLAHLRNLVATILPPSMAVVLDLHLWALDPVLATKDHLLTSSVAVSGHLRATSILEGRAFILDLISFGNSNKVLHLSAPLVNGPHQESKHLHLVNLK